MSFRHFLWTLVVVLFTVTACQEKDPILEEISNLIEQSESNLDLISEVNLDEINQFKTEAQGYMESLKPQIESMQQDMLQKFSTIANTVKLIKKRPFDKEELKKEVNFNTTQLKALYTARKNNSIKIDDIKAFVDKEREALGITTAKIKSLKITQNDICNNFKQFLPDLKQYIDSVKTY